MFIKRTITLTVFSFIGVITLLAGLGNVQPAQAQSSSLSSPSSQQVQSITLEEAIQIALENNTQIQRARNQIEQQEMNVLNATSQFIPDLSASVSGNTNIGRQFDEATISFDDITSSTISPGLSTSIPLFQGWQNRNNLRSARSSLEATEMDYERVRENVIFQTVTQYLQLLISEEMLEIERNNLEAAERTLDQIEALVEAGQSPMTDLYTQQAEVAGIELSILQQENELQNNKAQLISTLQVDPHGVYEFETPDIEARDFEPRDYDLGELYERAMRQRSDVEALRKTVEAQSFALEQARGGYYPSISLSASLGSSYRTTQTEPVPDGEGGFEQRDVPFTDQLFDQNISRGFGVNISIPIFNRFQTRNQVRQQEVAHRNARLDLEEMQYEITQEIQQEYNNYQSYAKQLEVSGTRVQAAERAYEATRDRYEEGSADLVELTNANQNYIEALSNRVQARYQFVFQEKVLEYYIGEVNGDLQFTFME